MPFLKAIQDQFHSCRHAKFFENLEKIVPDDCGSTVLGFVIAFLALSLYGAGPINAPTLLFPLLTGALPLLDAFLAVLRRLRRRKSPVFGDRAHIYDILSAGGWAVPTIALACCGVTAALSAIAMWGVRSASRNSWEIESLMVGILLTTMIRLGSLRNNDASPRAEGSTEGKIPGIQRRISSTD